MQRTFTCEVCSERITLKGVSESGIEKAHELWLNGHLHPELDLYIVTRRVVPNGRHLVEKYRADNLMEPEDMLHRLKRYISVSTQAEAEEYAARLIAKFNATCSPGEAHRELVLVKFGGPAPDFERSHP